MTNTSGYSTTGSSAGPISAGGTEEKGYWDIGKLKKAYSDYLNIKQPEIEEAKEARRYYHGAQWTDEQLKELKRRKQPATFANRINRKIDGVVGVLERMRQDPKAYPRTPQHTEGADLATAAIRYVLDDQEWQPKSSEVARDGGIEGISGIAIELVKSDSQDPNDHDIGFDIVEPDSFYYDPRSYRADFSDAEYMGLGKWVSVGKLKRMFPDKAEEIEASVDGDGADLSSYPDRDQRWFSSDRRFVRVCDCWYEHDGKWCFGIHTGSTILMEGDSYLFDEKGQTECKYVMYSGNVDHDGDRYGFVRNMKPLQDSINYKESKLNHIMNSRRLIMTQGAVEDIEKTRIEWSRPDGVVVKNPGSEIERDDQSFDFTGLQKLLEDSKTEIENFGPNPAVLGEGVEKSSGRAIQLLQQAGIAELGPYITAYRGWKIRVYRIIFNAIQRHWTAERWVRVTDDEQVQQYIQINGMGVDPNTGHPTMVNALGSLDVDIILDEGPDTINMAADTYDALLALAQSGAQVPPQVLLELAPGIDGRTKKKILGMLEQAAQQPNPEVQKAQAQVQADQMKAQADQQLKAQEAATGAQLDREKAALDAEIEVKKIDAQAAAAERKSIRDAEIARQKAEAEIALKEWVAAQELRIEAARNEKQIALERERGDQQMEIERFKTSEQANIERFKTNESVTNEREKIKFAKEAKSESEKPKKAEADRLGNLEKMVAELSKKQARRLVRGKDGKIIGAEPVERLEA
jgi:hypothetical protein